MSMFFNKGKIKKLLCAAALTVCCMVPMTIDASASSQNEIKLEANGSEASLELCFPQAAAEEISSMQVSVRVRTGSENVDLEFIPDSGLASKIAESRYQSDTGMLNIYLAGTNALFSSYGFTKVGKIKISTSGNNSASATVEVVTDSVRFVRSGELVSPDGDTDYPAAVTLTAAGHSSPSYAEYPNYSETPNYPETPNYSATPNYTGYTNQTGYPSVNYFPNISVSNGDGEYWQESSEMPEPAPNDGNFDYSNDTDGDYYNYDFEEQEQIGENMNPPDKTALLYALSLAAEYRESDYSESSYAALKEAVNKAKKVLSDPYATQDDIDEALLEIENAIGMLILKDDIPSGAEGYGKNSDTDLGSADFGIFGDNEYAKDRQPADMAEGGNNAQAVQNGNVVNASDSGSADNGLFSESGKGFALPAILIAAVIAVAAAAVIVLKRLKEKKSVSGNHFKD